MKKYKLSKKAESYLKAQGGLQVPYENPYQDDTTPFDLGQIDPSLQAAQQNQIVQAPSSAAPANQKSNVLGSLSNFGSLGAGIKMGTGLISLFQSFEEKRKAKRREFNAKRDLENRMKESRENDFYYTGQTSGSYSDFNKNGGLVYQNGGLTFAGRDVNPDYIESLKTGNGGYPKKSSDKWQQLAKLDSGDTIVKADTGEIFLRNNKDGKYFTVDMKQVEHLIPKKQPVVKESKPAKKLPEVKYRDSVDKLPKSTQDYSTKEETKLQKEWLQKYMKSDLYKERLNAEGFKNPEQEASIRLNNLNTAPISYVDKIGKRPKLISGIYTPEHKIKLESEYKPSEFNPDSGFETIPLHEMYHASDRGGKRIPKQTIKNIQDRTNTPTNPFEKYYTTPTEFIGRIQPTRYLLQREGIYDASKKVFDEKDYENMLKNRGVRENTHFQEFYENVKGSTPEEKKENFIWFMNNIAQSKQDNLPIAQQGGFMDFYNQKEQQNKQTQNIWDDYYNNYVEQQKQKAKSLQQEGLSDIISGATDQLSMAASVLTGGVMKRGGILSKAIRYQNGGLNLDSLKTSPMPQSSVQTSISNLTPEHFNVLQPDTVTNESIDRDREAYVWDYKKNNQPMFDLIMGRDPEKIRTKPYRAFDKSRIMKQDGGNVEEVNEDLYSADFQSPVQQNQDAQSYFTEVMNKYQALDPQGSLENKAMSWIFEEEQEPKRYDTMDIFQNQNVGSVPPKGDIATSHNNPGNIKYGQFAQKYGATIGRGATDGGKFAYFPTVEAGLQAQKDLLTSGGYANLTVTDAMKRWSNSGYGADLYPEVANKKMKDLTPQELNELVLRQTKRESPTIYNKIYGQ